MMIPLLFFCIIVAANIPTAHAASTRTYRIARAFKPMPFFRTPISFRSMSSGSNSSQLPPSICWFPNNPCLCFARSQNKPPHIIVGIRVQTTERAGCGNNIPLFSFASVHKDLPISRLRDNVVKPFVQTALADPHATLQENVFEGIYQKAIVDVSQSVDSLPAHPFALFSKCYRYHYNKEQLNFNPMIPFLLMRETTNLWGKPRSITPYGYIQQMYRNDSKPS